MTRNQKGKAYLVGAGPGDPGLLTIKGKECLELADVVIYDNLVNRFFLEYASDQAERIYVGKKGGCHTMRQEEINQLLVQKTQEGKTVVRLKGGDPYIFGRGGEEAQELVKAGLAFEVVPGITSAIAVPAYGGIPLTHRDYTATVTFITGHESPLKEESNIAWDKIATGAGTLVFLMGVTTLGSIAENLIKHGLPPETPAAVIRRGTLPEQKTLTGTLQNIAHLAKENRMRPPAVIVVGDVVRLREELNWFEHRPLFGKRIIITRAREQASEFSKALTKLGADCIEFPTIEVVPPESWEELDRAIERLHEYDWLIFTSVNGTKYFLERLEAGGRDVRDLNGLKIAAIGPKTAEVWTRFGIRPDLVPEEYRAEAVVDCFRRQGPLNGLRVLLPKAAKAREVLPKALSRMGAVVDEVTAYQTIMPLHNLGQLREMLDQGLIDMITFTSSSTVENLIEIFDGYTVQLLQWMKRVAIACIGPITAKTAENKGLKPDVVSSEYTMEGLTQAILEYFAETLPRMEKS